MGHPVWQLVPQPLRLSKTWLAVRRPIHNRIPKMRAQCYRCVRLVAAVNVVAVVLVVIFFFFFGGISTDLCVYAL